MGSVKNPRYFVFINGRPRGRILDQKELGRIRRAGIMNLKRLDYLIPRIRG